ncbi:hypothetical protein [Persicirhabdus sediminis]|nr:hypothetical protein [Persicirhabdus sediminis]
MSIATTDIEALNYALQSTLSKPNQVVKQRDGQWLATASSSAS